LLDDLAQETLRRMLVAEGRGTEIDSVEAFVNVLAQRAAIDLLRRAVRDPISIEDVERRDWVDDGHEIEAVDAVLVGIAVRGAVARRVGSVPARAAAALAYLAAMVDGAVVADDCPQPGKGAGPTESAEWAGLWYAGRDDCFADGGAAVRKRRSRAVADLRELLVDAAADAGIVDG
jgi:hypothetical protein